MWHVGTAEAAATHPGLSLSGTAADQLGGAADLSFQASPGSSRSVSGEVTAAAIPLTFAGIVPKKCVILQRFIVGKTLTLTK